MASRQGRRRSLAFAAAMLTVGVVAGLLARGYYSDASSRITYQTAANESRTEELPDGSTVSMGAGTQLLVLFTAERRRVQLLGGEAEFTVAEDAARPFVVGTFLADLVGGTKFRVLVNATLHVTAYEGAVRVLAHGAKGSGGHPPPGVLVVPGKPYHGPDGAARAALLMPGAGQYRRDWARLVS